MRKTLIVLLKYSTRKLTPICAITKTTRYLCLLLLKPSPPLAFASNNKRECVQCLVILILVQALHIAFWNQHKEIQQLIIDAGGLLQTESTFAYEEYEPEPEPEIEIGDVDNIADFAKFFSKKK